MEGGEFVRDLRIIGKDSNYYIGKNVVAIYNRYNLSPSW